MATPNPRSALTQLQDLAASAKHAALTLLQVSELRRADVVGGDYYEWQPLTLDAKVIRSKASALVRAFEGDLRWILILHDPLGEQRRLFFAKEVADIIDQQSHTRLKSVREAEAQVQRYFDESLFSMLEIYDPLEDENLIIPDTNVFLDFPDLEGYHLGLPKVRLVLTPTVLKELDAKKRARDVDIVHNARSLIRRLKDCGDRGNILEGVPISDRVILMTRAAEPRRQGLLNWLDLDVPDDRFIASSLEVARQHPKAKVLVVSGDFNVLNRARAARLSAFDPEDYLGQDQSQENMP